MRSRTGTFVMVAVVAAALAPPSALASVAAPALSPEPGTPDASPNTQISIFGVAPSVINSVTVRGSQSGAHRGRLERYSAGAGAGASFVLKAPLAVGERVAVRVMIAGRRPISYSFSVEHPGVIQPVLNIAKQQPAKLDHFVSEPDLLPPQISVEHRDGALHRDIFVTPLPSPIVHPQSNNAITINPVGPGGPMIIDPSGRVIWFHQLPNPDVAANFRPQRYNGHEVLTWWQGGVTPSAFGLGEGVIASTSYRTLKVVHAGNGYSMDTHEFVLTPAGDALFTVYQPILVHLPGTAAGKLSPLLDAIVQEVDIRTGLVVWEWHSYGHIPLRDSYASPANSADFDAFHLNSIQELPGGRLLVSARDTSAVYEIDQATGRILWTLGGKASSFRLSKPARFHFQHDAQLLRGNRVSMFDDEGAPPAYASQSRGLVLALNLRARTAKVVHQYVLPQPGVLSESEGDVEPLAGGGVFVGFGSQPYFGAFAPRGRLLFEASLPVDDGSYREYSYPWSATPAGTRPAVAAVRSSSGQLSVYASWNGASTVRRWQVLGGAGAAALTPLATAADQGFETRITVTGAARVAVRAIGAGGKVLATSATVSPT